MILGKKTQEDKIDQVMESFEDITFEPVEESYELSEIMLESVKASTQLESALLIADIMLEEASLQGEDVEIALEATFKDTMNSIIKHITDFIKSIGGFFDKMIQSVKIMVVTGEKFISKYGTQIKDAAKNAEGFKYEIYKYDLDLLKSETTATDKFTADKATLEAEVGKEKTKSEDEFLKQFRGEKKVDFSEGVSIDKMMETIKNGKEILAAIEKTKKTVIEANDKVIKECKEAANKKDENVDKYNKMAKAARDMSNEMTKHIKKVKNGYFEASREFETCLKKLLSYKGKPVKDSKPSNTEPEEVVDVKESASLLDTALKFIM